jgi:lipoate-protein ligase A
MLTWQLIINRRFGSGHWNMAVDDYLFQSLASKPGTIVRFYGWKRPTVSLGYSQKIQKVVDVDYCREQGIDIVRRMTGGKLVFHHREVTYSVCSSDTSVFTSKLGDSYRLISEALMRGLQKMGLTPSLSSPAPAHYTRGSLPCFSYPTRNEVEVGGRKIIGSAQKRVGETFIQHGSIPLEEDNELLKSLSFLPREEENVRMISLSEATGGPVGFNGVVPLFVEGMEEYFHVGFELKSFSGREKAAIRDIEGKKYGNRGWTFMR